MTSNPNPSLPSSPVSNDTLALMKFQSRAKSTGTAYLLWFFLGSLGGHRFYLGKTGTAMLMLACTVIGLFTLFPLLVTLLIGLYDLFTLPSQVRAINDGLMADISSGKGS
ncbi:TM2 domain-containing protein [Paracoccus sp. (in: a-proteobacteria)]|uniref:TM2 domain-containing protein n=1 Tax=Paracoccus sp. TaxID=267 RepID=UPI00321FE2E8